MVISYDDDDMREVCHDLQVASKRFGKQVARKIHRKMASLDASATLADYIKLDVRSHWLEGNRHWEFSIPLALGKSLLLTPLNRTTRAHLEIDAMKILRVEDYHR